MHLTKIVHTVSVPLWISLVGAVLTGCDPASQSGNAGAGTGERNLATASLGPESKYAGVYLCQSPAATLRLAADKSAGMMINGSPFKGDWSSSGETIEFKPEIGASSRFDIQGDGSLVEKKYGYKFEKISR